MKNITSFVLRTIPRKYLQLCIRYFPGVASLVYQGKGVLCAVCDRQFRRFMPYGRGASMRGNALCPNCLSLERHRLICIFLKQNTKIFDQSLRLLHVAPEHCFMRRFANQDTIDYVTADLESPLSEVKLDVHDIPFPSDSFDAVMCNHVLEHVDDDSRAMREICRILRPGGWAILQSPIDHGRTSTYEDASITKPWERELHFGQNDHQRVYGIDYEQRLTHAGFEVTKHCLTHAMSLEELVRFGLEAGEVIYFCKKPLHIEPAAPPG